MSAFEIAVRDVVGAVLGKDARFSTTGLFLDTAEFDLGDDDYLRIMDAKTVRLEQSGFVASRKFGKVHKFVLSRDLPDEAALAAYMRDEFPLQRAWAPPAESGDALDDMSDEQLTELMGKAAGQHVPRVERPFAYEARWETTKEITCIRLGVPGPVIAICKDKDRQTTLVTRNSGVLLAFLHEHGQ